MKHLREYIVENTEIIYEDDLLGLGDDSKDDKKDDKKDDSAGDDLLGGGDDSGEEDKKDD